MISTQALYSKEMADTTHLLNEVVVTGSNIAVGRNLLPYTVSTVTGKQLEIHNFLMPFLVLYPVYSYQSVIYSVLVSAMVAQVI